MASIQGRGQGTRLDPARGHRRQHGRRRLLRRRTGDPHRDLPGLTKTSGGEVAVVRNGGIEGTIYFTLNLGDSALRQFDNKFGTRKFRGLDGVLRFPSDGDDG
jgi:hypothetical protein